MDKEVSLTKPVSPPISQYPAEIFRRTKLTNADLSMIQNNLGAVDINSFHSKAYSKSATIYSASIRTSQSSKSIIIKLLIVDNFTNNNHILTTYIGSVESFDKDVDVLTNTNKIINGKITLYNLNTGMSISSIIEAGIDKGVTKTSTTLRLNGLNYAAADFSTCFGDCVGGIISNMSWLERAICLLDIELCVPGMTIGCTIKCSPLVEP